MGVLRCRGFGLQPGQSVDNKFSLPAYLPPPPPPPAPMQVQFSFDGDRHLTHWLTIIGKHAAQPPYIEVELVRSGDTLKSGKHAPTGAACPLPFPAEWVWLQRRQGVHELCCSRLQGQRAAGAAAVAGADAAQLPLLLAPSRSLGLPTPTHPHFVGPRRPSHTNTHHNQ